MGQRTSHLREKRSLQKAFAARGLDLTQVWSPHPDEPELEIRQLRQLLNWVEKYERHGSRAKMEAHGFLFPPIDPGFDPDMDWDRFEKWLRREPLFVFLRDLLPDDFVDSKPEDLSDEEIESAIATIEEVLAAHNHRLETADGMPRRLVYRFLIDEYIRGDMDIPTSSSDQGVWHIDACSGYCPGCFQRPWCESGQEIEWPEDEVAGHMAVPDCVQPYVSSVPMGTAEEAKVQPVERLAKSGTAKQGDRPSG